MGLAAVERDFSLPLDFSGQHGMFGIQIHLWQSHKPQGSRIMMAHNLSSATFVFRACLTSVMVLAITLLVHSQEPAIKAPVEVKIQDDKAVVVEAVQPLDPVSHVQLRGLGNMYLQVR